MFSGGRTSGYMLNKLMEADKNFKNNYIVCFANTGKERQETLDFVHACEVNFDVEINWLEYRLTPAKDIPPVYPTEKRNNNLKKKAELGYKWHWYKKVNHETASMDVIPIVTGKRVVYL
jgi:3'-phosphoadenosine 5'-phosphosulfate sulfotransferase (PAPS reductase)/FAD synthetase